MTAVLTGREAVSAAAHHLRGLGFRLQSRSPSGSAYLRWPGCPFTLRVADHQWSPFNGRRMVHVAFNALVFGLAPDEAPLAALDIGIRFIAAVRHRTGVLGKEAA